MRLLKQLIDHFLENATFFPEIKILISFVKYAFSAPPKTHKSMAFSLTCLFPR